MNEIRLACMNCDREDYDGISEVPTDWQGVAEATEGYWWTHLGWCPECVAAGALK